MLFLCKAARPDVIVYRVVVVPASKFSLVFNGGKSNSNISHKSKIPTLIFRRRPPKTALLLPFSHSLYEMDIDVNVWEYMFKRETIMIGLKRTLAWEVKWALIALKMQSGHLEESHNFQR